MACSHLDALLSQPRWLLLLLSLGLLSSLSLSLRLLRFLFTTFLRSPKPLRRRYGPWAIVTGATDGIGKSIALNLARHHNLNLLLIGRNPTKLQQTQSEIQSLSPNSKIQTLVIDFAGDLLAGVDNLKAAIKDLDVGILVNNAGVSYPYATYFHEVDADLVRDLIKVNVEGVTRVTHAVIPRMVERKRGAVVNIGSGAATVIPSDPLYTVYAATKA